MGLTDEPPTLDDRTAHWLSCFNVLSRGRPAGFSGIPPIPPQLICDMVERLDWPCALDEAIHVLTSMDDTFREMQEKKS